MNHHIREGFSARQCTWSNRSDRLQSASTIRVWGSKNVNHIAYLVHAKDKYAALKRIPDYYPQIYGIIFCRTRKETQELFQG